LKAAEQATLPKAFAVWWTDFLRWSVSYNQQAQSGVDITQGKYPVLSLNSCLEMVQYGTSEKANSAGRGTPVLRINNVKGRTIDTSHLKHLELPEKVRRGLLLSDGDILVIRTSGSRDLVGTCAVFHELGQYVFASYLIRLRPDLSKANSDFIVWFLNSSLGRQQVDATSRQIMQNNINSEELRSLQIPLPPLPVQQAMMKRVEAGRAEIAALKADAQARADAAKADVEAMILGQGASISAS
jgi:type I restriction enzyme, S subunit